ncbi:integrase family protein [Rhodomicrobium vannielii ATCC 17100]|uniref:Integrase family protein n=1 Tax=Rhodomicrobium vannielii (strain ATCC 17100 / DSM 162 / LMG 4299 / NCIMB 10020 / ATH 3.1.1) TaxID=648757 RepID=E3I5I1_RHOVT|nr:site-specific integrase [Rhodomicrobium vannielii]ADP71702.1 integrase family protein [Rhodomicrobium vannielii ATCC 17100]
MTKALTVRALENMRPGASRREIPDGIIQGLYFVHQPSGAKSWAVRYRVGGQTRKLTLGTYPAIGLKPARDLASTALAAVARGEDPAKAKKAAKEKEKAAPARDFVEAVAASFIERHSKQKNKETHIRETERILQREIVPVWKGRKLGDITRADVHEVLDAIVNRGCPTMANRTLSTVRKMCAWAVDRSFIAVSPCHGIKAPASEKSRDRLLSEDEMRAAWLAFEATGWPFGPLAKLLLATAQRRDEVADMRWSEIDFKTRIWTIPAARSKNGQAHEVPLSEAALAILDGLPHVAGVSDYVFTTTGKTPVSGFSRAKKAFDEQITRQLGEGIPGWTLHDLRRTAASGMTALKSPPHVVDAVLNHKSGTIKGVSAVYMRYGYAAEKRTALDAWGHFLTTIISSNTPCSNMAQLGTDHDEEETEEIRPSR